MEKQAYIKDAKRDMGKVLVSEQEAAQLLSTTVATLRRWESNGRHIPQYFIQDGKRVYWVKHLYDFLAEYKFYPVNGRPTCARPPRGFVYLIRSGKHYKIGITENPAQRMRSLNQGSPEPITKLIVQEVSNPVGIEMQLHEKYSARRVHGEWFRFGRDEAEEVRKYIAGLSYAQ